MLAARAQARAALKAFLVPTKPCRGSAPPHSKAALTQTRESVSSLPSASTASQEPRQDVPSPALAEMGTIVLTVPRTRSQHQPRGGIRRVSTGIYPLRDQRAGREVRGSKSRSRLRILLPDLNHCQHFLTLPWAAAVTPGVTAPMAAELGCVSGIGL